MSSPSPLEEIFFVAIEKRDPDERASYLDEACGTDRELRRLVERMLMAQANAGSFLEAPAGGMQPTLDQPLTERLGSQIGPYKLLEEIGQGGMGVVYMAEQTEPVKRRVALKIIKPGMDTRQVIARFEAERQALAMMDHPNIAKVLDGGTTDSGRPYFVMELVNGVRVTDYCDEQHLSPKERLELFVPICQAVQHAHQKGIIHRDLKPSNILIALYDGQPVPKVIDFGVAKATSQTLTDKTLFTQLGQVVGTVEYMSPEQAQRNQLDIDTRSDVYSLGVVLYELLTGTTPFGKERLREAAFDEILRIIREEEPQRPSLRLSSIETLPSVAANRRIEPQKLRTLVRGELDWIVMKALEKDRARRYETANGFAEDIQHYLNDEAVVACPPSRAYRFRKFARRNRAPLVTAAAVIFALVSGVVVSTWQWVRAEQARRGEAAQRELAEGQRDRAQRAEKQAETEARRANREAAISKAVNDFVNNDLLEFADPQQEPDRNIPLRTVLDRASKETDRFQGAPLVEASIRHTLGKTYLSLGEYETAEPQLERAVDLRRKRLGDHHRDTLRSMHLLAQTYHKQAQFQEAERLNEETYTLRLKHFGEEDADTLESMSSTVAIHNSLGRYSKAESLCKRTLKIMRRVHGRSAEATLTSMVQQAEVAYLLDRYRQAEQLCYETLAEMEEAALRTTHPLMLAVKSRLAIVYRRLRRLKEAKKLHYEVLDTKKAVLGEEHPDTLMSMQDIGWWHSDGERYRAAHEWFERLYEKRTRVLGTEHPDTLFTKFASTWMTFFSGAANTINVDDRLEDVYNDFSRVLGPEHPDTLYVLSVYALITGHLGNYDKSVRLQQQCLESQQRVLGRDHPKTFKTMARLAGIYAYYRLDKSYEVYRQALEGQRRVFGENSIRACYTIEQIAWRYRNDRPRETESDYEHVIKIYTQTYGQEHSHTLTARQRLAMVQGRWEDRLKILERMLEFYVREEGEHSHRAQMTMNGIAHTYRSLGDYAKAEEIYKQRLQMAEHTRKGLNASVLRSLGVLYSMWGDHRYDEAQQHFNAALGIWLSEKPDHPRALRMLKDINDLAVKCFIAGRYTQVEELCRRVLQVKSDQADAARNLSAALLMAKDREGYRNYCLTLLNQHGTTTEPNLAETIAACFALHAWSPTELKQPLELARLAVNAKRNAQRLNTLGALLFRAGRFKDAEEELSNATKQRGDEADAIDWLWLSMTYHALGDTDKARTYFRRGAEWLAENEHTATMDVLEKEVAQYVSLLEE